MKDNLSVSVLRSIFLRKGGEDFYTRLVTDNRLHNNLVFEIAEDEIIIVEHFGSENNWVVVSNLKTVFCADGITYNVLYRDLKKVSLDIKSMKSIDGHGYVALQLHDGTERLLVTEKYSSVMGIYNVLSFAVRP